MKKFLLCLCSVFILCNIANSSTIYYVTVFMEETWSLFKSPVYWEKRDWLLAGAVVGTTFFLFTQDEKIKEISQRKRDEEFDRFLSIGNTFGDGYFVIPFISVSLISGYLFESGKLKEFGWKSLKSFLITGSVVVIMKVITNRERPDGSNRRAFPSGHSAVAFSLATSISEEFGDNKAIPVFVYSLAFMTALARVEYNVHWASDVFFGAVLGTYISKFIHSYGDNRISFYPTTNGIAVSWRF